MLPAAIESQASAAGITARIHRYPGPEPGEAAVRRGEVEVLVVDAARLEWRRQPDQQLRAVLTGAIQAAAVSDRVAAAGIAPGALSALLAPGPVDNVQLGSVTGRTSEDEMAALVMSVLLLVTISAYGSLVLTGVAEEKASRVVEVLLAHMPARSLLTGKVAGIGLLGLAQVSVTALAAFITVTFVRSAGIPAIRGSVLSWAVVWFLLGYALYAMLYTRAILHGGPALKLRDAWRGTPATGTPRAGRQPRTGARRWPPGATPWSVSEPRARGPGRRGRSYLHR